MKFTKPIISLVFLLCCGAFIWQSEVQTNSSQPPNGRTGAPSEGTCAGAGCHGNSTTPGDAELDLMIGVGTADMALDNTFEYTPSTQYTIQLDVDNSMGNEYGFEITAIDDSDNAAGNFTVTNSTNTVLAASGGRQYMKHRNSNSSHIWTFDWTAPASGNVNFYVVGNAANGNGNATGDIIYTKMVTIAENVPSGIADARDLNHNLLKVFPNPVIASTFHLSYEVFHDGPVSIEVYNATGKLVETINMGQQVPGSYEVPVNLNGDHPAGIYLVKLQTEHASSFQRFMIQ